MPTDGQFTQQMAFPVAHTDVPRAVIRAQVRQKQWHVLQLYFWWEPEPSLQSSCNSKYSLKTYWNNSSCIAFSHTVYTAINYAALWEKTI